MTKGYYGFPSKEAHDKYYSEPLPQWEIDAMERYARETEDEMSVAAREAPVVWAGNPEWRSITVGMTIGVYGYLDELAKLHKLTRSEVVRRVLIAFVQRGDATLPADITPGRKPARAKVLRP